MHSVNDSRQTSFDASGMIAAELSFLRPEPNETVLPTPRTTDVELPGPILDALSELYWLERARPQHVADRAWR
jgi:hypothetical protein